MRCELRRLGGLIGVLISLLPIELASAAERKLKAEKLDQSVRALIAEHCGSCHDGARPTAKPAALKIFDLVEDDWAARMTNDQLKKVIGRAKGVELSPRQLEQVVQFINLKLEQRKR